RGLRVLRAAAPPPAPEVPAPGKIRQRGAGARPSRRPTPNPPLRGVPEPGGRPAEAQPLEASCACAWMCNRLATARGPRGTRLALLGRGTTAPRRPDVLAGRFVLVLVC